MKSAKKAGQLILELVEEQIQLGKPAEVKMTLERLKGMGITEINARKLIAQCLAVQLYGVMQKKKSFDQERYVRDLEALPHKPSMGDGPASA